jgi:hypothetical protein
MIVQTLALILWHPLSPTGFVVFGKIVRAIIFVSAALTFVLFVRIMRREMLCKISQCDSAATCTARARFGAGATAKWNVLDCMLR